MKAKISVLVLGCVAGASLLFGAGCVQRRVVYVREPAVAPAPGEEIVVTETPPPPQVEVVGLAPGPDFVWMPGCWEWRGHWVWAGGRWAIGPHPHARWIPGRWTRHGRNHVWIRGYWR